MAKQKGQDRNAVALIKAQRNAQSGTWTSENGRVIRLKKADMVFVQMATSSVELPDPPTYTVKIGKAEREYPLDEVVIAQTDDPVEKAKLTRRWNVYQQTLGAAYGELAKRASGAIFYEGTVPDMELLDSDGAWFKKMKISGWKLPSDQDELWVLYLQTSLTDDEIASLSEAIARYRGGPSEEMIGAAEKSFPDDVPPDTEPGDVADAGSDTEGD